MREREAFKEHRRFSPLGAGMIVRRVLCSALMLLPLLLAGIVPARAAPPDHVAVLQRGVNITNFIQ